MKLFKRLKCSLFAKLFFTMLIGTLCIEVVFIFSMKTVMRPHVENTIRKMMVDYTELLFEDVTEDADSVQLMQLAEQSGMAIIAKRGGEIWKSTPEVEYFPFKENNSYFLIEDEQFGFRFGRAHTRIWKGDTEFLMVTNMKGVLAHMTLIQMLMPFIGIGIILLVSYLFIRRIIRPVKVLIGGINKIGAGQLEHRIPVETEDELGKLAGQFNVMGDKIAEMVARKEQLLRDVSHELKTPLTRSMVALEFLPESDIRNRLHSDFTEMNDMLSEILETERLRSSYGGLLLEECDIVPMVSSIIERLKEFKMREISFVVKESSVLCYVDVERIRMVISNLIENSLKYSSESNLPTVVTIDADELHCIISVKDDGQGIPLEEQGKIFEPFYRVDKDRSRKSGGYGLGLHLCKQIISAHKGTIKVESKPNIGTDFQVTIPKGNEIKGAEHE